MTNNHLDAGARTADRNEFQALLDDWAAAIVANDAALIATFTEPSWELVTPESGPIPLERFLDAVRSGSLTHSDMTFDVRSVRRHGAVVSVVAHGSNHGEFDGEPFSADEWVTEVFALRDGRWRCVLSALTPNLSARAANLLPDPAGAERARPADLGTLAHNPSDLLAAAGQPNTDTEVRQ